jgi:hypothetical protein
LSISRGRFLIFNTTSQQAEEFRTSWLVIFLPYLLSRVTLTTECISETVDDGFLNTWCLSLVVFSANKIAGRLYGCMIFRSFCHFFLLAVMLSFARERDRELSLTLTVSLENKGV